MKEFYKYGYISFLLFLSNHLGSCTFINQNSPEKISNSGIGVSCGDIVEQGRGATGVQNEAPVLLGKVPEKSWVRPHFDIPDGHFEAGTAFVVSQDGAAFLLTAHHLFGPSGGLDREYSWLEIPNLVSGASGVNPSSEVSVFAGRALAVKGARGLSETQVNADLAIFPILSKSKVHAMTLAETLPSVGDVVWLVGEVIGRSGYKHKAVIEEISKEAVYYRFFENIELRRTSGAPIIDENSRVVAMNLGGGQDRGNVYGVGSPAAIVRCRLKAASQAISK